MGALKSFISGKWYEGTGRPAQLVNPSTEEVIAEANADGIDFAQALSHARNHGGTALRALSFAKRGELLRTMSKVIHAHRDALIELAMINGGNTRSDAKFDIDGASGTLAFYGELGQTWGDATTLIDAPTAALGRSSRLSGQHLMTSRRGVAVHINAYNFPAWGLCEKAAVALLAGMPVIAKPATSTALLAVRIMELFQESAALPEGALQLVVGSPGNLVDLLTGQDVLAFTGSSATASWLRARPGVVSRGTHVNIEADSLNSAILGTDAQRGEETWNLFLSDVVRDISQKSGQKCTAIRRAFVPRPMLEAVLEDLADRLGNHRVGDPRHTGVTVGPVVTASQLKDVREGMDRLGRGVRRVLGGSEAIEGLGAPAGKGYFVAPTLFAAEDALRVGEVHSLEVFGPCATVLPYDSLAQCSEAVALGEGCLVSTVYSDDRSVAAEIVPELLAWNGRVALANARLGSSWPGPGTVLPQLLHGGPGRAGGGEELGGVRGLFLYFQRTALEGFGPLVEQLTASAARSGG